MVPLQPSAHIHKLEIRNGPWRIKPDAHVERLNGIAGGPSPVDVCGDKNLFPIRDAWKGKKARIRTPPGLRLSRPRCVSTTVSLKERVVKLVVGEAAQQRKKETNVRRNIVLAVLMGIQCQMSSGFGARWAPKAEVFLPALYRRLVASGRGSKERINARISQTSH